METILWRSVLVDKGIVARVGEVSSDLGAPELCTGGRDRRLDLIVGRFSW